MANTQGERPAPTGGEPLSKQLFGGSAEIHRKAERRPFMVVFFKAELSKDAYIAYLGRLFHIYSALERVEGLIANDPVAGVMASPELHRSAAIEKDMEFLAGADWRTQNAPSPATATYVDAIEATAKDFPPAFAAHQWLRYLGNVLAEQVNLRIMKRAYDFDEQGTAFYRFPIGDRRAYLGEYHAKLNAMPLGEDDIARVVAEANKAWQLQIDFTDEMADDFGLRPVSEDEAEQLMAQLAANHP